MTVTGVVPVGGAHAACAVCVAMAEQRLDEHDVAEARRRLHLALCPHVHLVDEDGLVVDEDRLVVE